MINTINEEEVFAINPDCEIKLEHYDTVPCVIVDNFYKNPDLVRELALSIPPTANKRIRCGNPALRINAFYDLDGMSGIYDQLLRTNWPHVFNNVHHQAIHNSFQQATFMVNVMKSVDLPPMAPHVDNPSDVNFASTIYLNTPEECAGGTSFYKFNGSTSNRSGHIDKEKTKIIDHYLTDSVGDWEMIGIAEMVYNRMVLYNQNALHTAYIKPDMFVDTYRINQQFFI